MNEKKTMPTRTIENGTPIVMHFDDTTIPALLNDTETAKALYDMLPVTITVGNSSGLDFCGQVDFKLPYDPSQVHYGWLNGDIDYNPGGGWLAILFGGEEDSSAFGDQVTIGVLDCPLETISSLSGSFRVRINRLETE